MARVTHSSPMQSKEDIIFESVGDLKQELTNNEIESIVEVFGGRNGAFGFDVEKLIALRESVEGFANSPLGRAVYSIDWLSYYSPLILENCPRMFLEATKNEEFSKNMESCFDQSKYMMRELQRFESAAQPEDVDVVAAAWQPLKQYVIMGVLNGH
jgi:hypothetical protein